MEVQTLSEGTSFFRYRDNLSRSNVGLDDLIKVQRFNQWIGVKAGEYLAISDPPTHIWFRDQLPNHYSTTGPLLHKERY